MKVMCIKKCQFQTFTIEPGEWLEVYQESFEHSRTNGNFGTYTFEKNGNEHLCKRDYFITQSVYRQQQLDKLC
jgi:hypothetical protein